MHFFISRPILRTVFLLSPAICLRKIGTCGSEISFPLKHVHWTNMWHCISYTHDATWHFRYESDGTNLNWITRMSTGDRSVQYSRIRSNYWWCSHTEWQRYAGCWSDHIPWGTIPYPPTAKHNRYGVKWLLTGQLKICNISGLELVL